MTEEKVWPDTTDNDLWEECREAMIAKYGERFSDAEMRKAFEAACEHYEEYVPKSRFIKKAVIGCVWERPHIIKKQQA